MMRRTTRQESRRCTARIFVALWCAAVGTATAQPGNSARTIALPASATPAAFTLRTLVGGDRLEAGLVVALIADEQGSVYVADRGRKQIAVFDSAGRLVRTIGRSGQGPGEFRSLTDLAWLGDTLVVADLTQRRITLFSRDGRHLTAWPITSEIAMLRRLIQGGPSLAAAVMVREGPVIAAAHGQPVREAVRRYYHFTPTGEAVRIAGVEDATPEPRGSDCETTGGAIEILEPPFADRGPLAARRANGELALATRDRYRIDFLDPRTGVPATRIDRPYPELRVTDPKWQAEAARFIALGRAGAIQCTPRYERPELQPIIRAMTSDERGRLWLEVTTATGFALNIVDPNAASVSESVMPSRDPRVAPYARGNRLYIVAIDADGVQSIQVYSRR